MSYSERPGDINYSRLSVLSYQIVDHFNVILRKLDRSGLPSASMLLCGQAAPSPRKTRPAFFPFTPPLFASWRHYCILEAIILDPHAQPFVSL
jgi:hypothetical protein